MRISSMALTSPAKHSDLELLKEYADIVEITYRIYKANPTEEIKRYLDGFIESYQQLQHKIQTHDYTKDDAQYLRSQAIMRELGLSPE